MRNLRPTEVALPCPTGYGQRRNWRHRSFLLSTYCKGDPSLISKYLVSAAQWVIYKCCGGDVMLMLVGNRTVLMGVGLRIHFSTLAMWGGRSQCPL